MDYEAIVYRIFDLEAMRRYLPEGNGLKWIIDEVHADLIKDLKEICADVDEAFNSVWVEG